MAYPYPYVRNTDTLTLILFLPVTPHTPPSTFYLKNDRGVDVYYVPSVTRQKYLYSYHVDPGLQSMNDCGSSQDAIEIFSVASSLFHYDGCSHLCGNDSRDQPSPRDIQIYSAATLQRTS